LQRSIAFALCLTYLAALAVVCYRRPLHEDFDRYIYEAIILQKSQPISSVYEKVKHESQRSEESSVLNSPQHLQELEPLYAIRPLYLAIVRSVSAFLPIQKAINLVSAASLFVIGIVVLFWTQKPIQTALLITAYPVLNLGRSGSPDALAGSAAIAALWLISEHQQDIAGITLLFLSLGLRTDNILILLTVLAWRAWEKRIPVYVAGICAIAAALVVVSINHWAGNYGWIVLFRYSFIGGGSPAQMAHTLSIHEYLSAFAAGFGTILVQLSIWLLIGIWAWIRRPDPLLLVAATATAAHFLLFPSPEIRYLIWAGIIAAVSMLRTPNVPSTPFDTARYN
jgi:hypothetical protein